MTPTIRLLSLAALAGSIGCRASSPPAPAMARTSAYVVQLGRDTIAVEQFTRLGDRVEGALAVRAPRTTVTRYVVSLAPGGAPALVESATRLPDGTLVPGGARGVTVTWANDSVITRVQRDSVITLRTRAPGAIPYINYAVAFIQMPIDAMRAAGRDSTVTAILPVGGRTTTPFTVRALGGNRYVADMFGFKYDVRTDDRGTIVTVDGTGTTQQFLITRRNAIDVAAVGAQWAEQERQSRTMGMLSPRDTVTAAIGRARIAVDYSRPATRGRQVFGANGVLNDTLWRTGANAATQLWTDAPVTIGGHPLAAGKYTLWTLAVPGRYQLIVNRQTGQWGTVYDPAQDVARVPLTASSLAQHVERFTIAIEPAAAGAPAGSPAAGTLRMRWATTELSVPIVVP